MSKSLGNLVFVSDLLKTADPRAIRLALMRHHYRAGFEWHDTDLDEGTALLHRLLAAAERPDGADPRPFAERVRAAIDDDLDAPAALEALDDLASAVLSGGGDPTAPGDAARARCPARHRPHRGPPAPSDGTRRRRAPAGATGNVGRPMQITITLPDGSDARLRAGRHRRRDRGVHRPGPGQGRAGGAGHGDGDAASGTTSPARSSTTPRVAIVTPDTADGREVLRHSTAHVMAQAVTDLFPGAKYAIGPAIDDGFYYDFELPDGAHFSDDDLERIEARMREIVAGRRAVRARGARPRARRRARSPTSPTRSRSSSGSTPPTPRRSATATSSRVYRNPRAATSEFGERRVRRPLPRPARAVDQAARRVQAHQGRRRVLAGRREAPDAAAHLRHRVGVEGRARGAPAPPRGGREARPPQARRRARPLLVPRRDRLRASRCSTRRAAPSAG